MEKVANKLVADMEGAWEAGIGQAALARFAIARIRAKEVDSGSQRAAARQLLFLLLAKTFGSCAGDWKIGKRASGAPAMESAGEAIEVSLSHSGSWVAAGISRGALIGVDIEQARPGRDTAGMARYLGWDTHPNGADGFYRQWTLWEALVKSRGGKRSGPGVEAVLDGGRGILHGFAEQPQADVFCALVLQTPEPSEVGLARLDQLTLQTW